MDFSAFLRTCTEVVILHDSIEESKTKPGYNGEVFPKKHLSPLRGRGW
jgi:hypothetical protein